MQDPLETEGVILIDEIELHLHPGWQQCILGDLTRAFPNIQFIVTTHSPQILTTVEPQSIQIIEWSTDRQSLTQVDFSKGAESQQLLQDILGVPPRPEQLDIVKKLRAYQELVHQGLADTPAALALRQEVDHWGAEYEPELRRLDVHIRLKAMKRA